MNIQISKGNGYGNIIRFFIFVLLPVKILIMKPIFNKSFQIPVGVIALSPVLMDITLLNLYLN